MTAGFLEPSHILCRRCGVPHEARHVVRDGKAFLEIACPEEPQCGETSSDARLFMYFRKSQLPAPPTAQAAHHLHFLHILDGCSMRCPICFANAQPDAGWRIELADVRRRAEMIKKDQGRFVTLIGGEPTEHPQILDILRILRREFGLNVSINTNGLRIGNDDGFLVEMKRAGLRKVCISFDTFSPGTSRLMRGADVIDVKLRAFDHAQRAGLNIGMTSTICRENIHEVGALMRFCCERSPAITLLLLQPLRMETGRCPAQLEPVDREMIVHEIARSGAVSEMMEEDFFAAPAISGIGLCTHPDCGALLPLVRHAREWRPWAREIDMGRFLRALNRIPVSGRLLARFRFLLALLRVGGIRNMARARNWFSGGPGDALFLVVVDNVMSPERLDCERLQRCSSCVCEADGTLTSLCSYYARPHPVPRKEAP